MRFWDSSAVVPLLVADETTGSTQKLYREDNDVLAWWQTEAERVVAEALGRFQARVAGRPPSRPTRRVLE